MAQDIMQLLTQLLRKGSTSPLLQTILEPLLAIQQRGFGDQQRNLTDIFRSAGALKGGSYGVAVPRLLGDQSLATSSLIGQTNSSMLGPLLQALISGRGQDLNRSAVSEQIAAANAARSADDFGTMAPAGGWPSMANPTSQSSGSYQAPATSQPIDLDQLLQTLSGGSSGGSSYSAPFQPSPISYGPWEDVPSPDWTSGYDSWDQGGW